MKLVFIHGAGGGAWEFERWVEVFGEGIALELEPLPKGLEHTTFQDYLEQIPPADVLIGASMGGALALAFPQSPKALILIGSPFPGRHPQRDYPAVIRWSQSALEETEAAMPDCTPEAIAFAHPRWRDESGAVLRAISQITPNRPTCPTLCIIPEDDDSVLGSEQLALAEWANADVLRYPGMSHVGPLLSPRAEEVAIAARDWLSKILSLSTE